MAVLACRSSLHTAITRGLTYFRPIIVGIKQFTCRSVAGTLIEIWMGIIHTSTSIRVWHAVRIGDWYNRALVTGIYEATPDVL
jgi:hypothetical protein